MADQVADAIVVDHTGQIISVLTGLQAAHSLQASGRAPSCLYWSPAGEWYEVDATLEGRDFADALLRNWLGPEPADGSLKEAMLAGGK